jgi:hypothetical protein
MKARVFMSLATATAVAAGSLAAGVGAWAFTGWTQMSSPTPGTYGSLLKAVEATSPADAWAVGGSAASTSNQTLAEHWNGSSWTAVATPDPVASCQDGNIQWTGNTLDSVAAVAPNDVWAVGHSCYERNALAEHWDGNAWRIVPTVSFNTGGDGIQNTLNGVAAVSTSNVWAVGTHTASNGAYQTLIEHWNGSAWSVVASPSPSGSADVLNAVAASGAGDVWAVGYQNGSARQPLIEHWNGSTWSVVPSPSRSAGSVLSAVAVLGHADVWAVGTQPASTLAPITLIEHWNGSTWSVVPSPNVSSTYGSSNDLRGIAADSPTDVYAVGMFQNASTNYHQHRPLTLHWNGTAWSILSTPSAGQSAELNGIASASGRHFGVGLYSQYQVNIYDGTYTAPRTYVLTG